MRRECLVDREAMNLLPRDPRENEYKYGTVPPTVSPEQPHIFTPSSHIKSLFQLDTDSPPSKMVKFTSVAVALAATITGTSAAFTKACNFPYDVCGWTLANQEFGISSPTPSTPYQVIIPTKR